MLSDHRIIAFTARIQAKKMYINKEPTNQKIRDIKMKTIINRQIIRNWLYYLKIKFPAASIGMI